MTGFEALQRFARRAAPEEHCDLCGAVVGTEHGHLVEPGNRRLLCACQACAILFGAQSGQRYKRVPSRVCFLPDFRLTDAQWESLFIPINMAFFYRSGLAGGVTAAYPSPAGATESLLALESWEEIAAGNPILQSMEPGVEALLVNRLGERRGFPAHQYFLVPIDQCFKLVGLVRANWRGLSGGEELWRVLEGYFADLTSRAGVSVEHHHA